MKLTEHQNFVLAKMRKRGLDFTAAATQEHWERGEEYYIDRRVNAKGIHRDFKKGNEDALAASTSVK